MYIHHHNAVLKFSHVCQNWGKAQADTAMSSLEKGASPGAEDKAQQLKAMAALPDVQNSIPSTHMVTHNHL